MIEWKWHGTYYAVEHTFYRGDKKWTVHKKLSFIAYWGIRMIHGKKKLHEMALRVSI